MTTTSSRIVVPARAEGHRLDVALAELIPGASRRGARAAIARGDLRISGSVCRIASKPVLSGDLLEWNGGPEIPEPPELPVIDETGDWLFCSKPADMLTEPAARSTIPESLGTGLEIARRLLVLSRGPRTFAGCVGGALKEENARKVYLAICERAPSERSGSVELPICRRNAWTFGAVRPDEARPADAKDAKSFYRTLAEGERGAIVAVRLFTGRTHQARIHLAAAGAPIAGDTIYGEAEPLGAPPDRVFLHAAALRFPWKGREVTLVAPPAEDWLAEAERRGLRLPEGAVEAALAIA